MSMYNDFCDGVLVQASNAAASVQGFEWTRINVLIDTIAMQLPFLVNENVSLYPSPQLYHLFICPADSAVEDRTMGDRPNKALTMLPVTR